MDGDIANMMAAGAACLAWWRAITLLPVTDPLPMAARGARATRAATERQRVSTSA